MRFLVSLMHVSYFVSIRKLSLQFRAIANPLIDRLGLSQVSRLEIIYCYLD